MSALMLCAWLLTKSVYYLFILSVKTQTFLKTFCGRETTKSANKIRDFLVAPIGLSTNILRWHVEIEISEISSRPCAANHLSYCRFSCTS